MEVYNSKLNSYGSLSRTPKNNIPKPNYSYDQPIYNKENIADSSRKDKSNNRLDDHSNYQNRARSFERKGGNVTQSSYNSTRNEQPVPASVAAANFSNFFNSPKNIEAELFKSQDKNSYRAKHVNKGPKAAFNKDERSSQSGSSDHGLQSKIDQIINSSLSIRERAKNNSSSALKPTNTNTSANSNQTFEEKTSEKLTLYTRLLNDMRAKTPKSRDFTNPEQQQNSSASRNNPSASSTNFYDRNAEANKKPYLDLKLSSVDFDTNKAPKDDPKLAKNYQRISYSSKKPEKSDENMRLERAEQQQEPPKRSESYNKQERHSFSKNLAVNTQSSSSDPHFAKHPTTVKNNRSGLRYNDNQSIYESLTSLKKSLERPITNTLAKSTTLNGPTYSNNTGNSNETPKEARSIFKSATPKANTVSSTEVKNILQSFKNVLHRESKAQGTDSSASRKTLDDEAYHKYLREGAHRHEEKPTTSSYSQRPPSSGKSTKYRENSVNLGRKQDEKQPPASITQSHEKAPPVQKSLKDFITQVNPADSMMAKTKIDTNSHGSERQSYTNIQGHPQSAKNSTRSVLNDKLLTVGGSTAVSLSKASCTTTNSSIAQEAKSFTFNSSLGNKHSSRNPGGNADEKHHMNAGQVKKEVQAVGATVCQYYMAGLQKYIKHGDTDNEYFSKIYKEHFLQGFQAINFCKYLKPVDPAELAKRKVYLQKKDCYKDKKTIIFDLDETLIHCNESASIPSDVVLPIKFPHGDVIEAGINVRPYAVEALEELSKHFEIIVFTASHSCYANVVLDHLDPQNKWISHRLFRENCVTTEEGLYIKDLRIFANRNLKDLVIVDNAMYSFGYQIDNGIPIIPFYYNKTDKELKSLVTYLKGLYHVKDVREINIKSFKLHYFSECGGHDEVLRRLFE